MHYGGAAGDFARFGPVIVNENEVPGFARAAVKLIGRDQKRRAVQARGETSW
jgi:hypothetical protein